MEQTDKDPDLIEYFEILWKRRWLIAIPTVIFALIAGFVSFLLPPEWEVDAIIQPSRILARSEDGKFTEVVVMDPKQIAGLIDHGTYDGPIAVALGLAPEKLPGITAEKLRDTDLVRVSLRTRDAAKGRPVLNALFGLVRNELDRKVDVETERVKARISAKENDIKAKDFDIQSLNIEIEKARMEIVGAGNKLKLSAERVRGLVEEMKGVKARLDEMENQQRALLAAKRNGVEALGLLLYANEVQETFRYYRTLEESLSTEKNAQEDLRLSLHEKEQAIQGFRTRIGRIDQEIAGLRAEREVLEQEHLRIEHTRLVKEPAVSSAPVFPKKKEIVAIAGILAFFSFSILALLLGSVERRKSRRGSGF